MRYRNYLMIHGIGGDPIMPVGTFITIYTTAPLFIDSVNRQLLDLAIASLSLEAKKH